MKKVLFILALIFSQTIYSQGAEICDNGIDDDGDGLTDINDPDCICNITSLIANNSFETFSQCPGNYGQLDKSINWVNANGSTSDYLNSCGFLLQDLTATGLYPFPHGNGVAGGAFLNDYKEYISTCLAQPLQANVNYTLKFYLSCFQLKNTNYSPTGKVCDNLLDFEPIALTLYGNTNCNNFSFSINGPNTNGWEVLRTLTYTPKMEWAEMEINFTPQSTVAAISLRAPLGILPPSYPTFSTIAPATQCSPYFLYDNLVLNMASFFEADNGIICYNEQLLTANPSFTVTGAVTYQWYNKGVAIAGATSAQYTMPEGTILDDITVKIIDTNQCAILKVFNEITPTPQLSSQECAGLLTAEQGAAPYQWYIDEIAIQITDVVDGLITFEITAKNLGPYNNTEVLVSDLLPGGYNYTSYTSDAGIYTATSGVWNIGNLAAGAETTIYISAQVETTGIHTNTATIIGRNIDIDLDNNTASVTPEGKMYLSKRAEEAAYYAEGDLINYILELTNTGNVTVHNIAVADENADIGSISPAQIISLAPGATAIITAKHTITAADVVNGKVINQATAIGESFNGLYVKTNSDDPVTPAVQDATVTIIEASADLSITKTDGKETYLAGDMVTYTITVTNHGPSVAHEVLVEDQLPQGITVMQWTGSNETGDGMLQQTISTLNVGEAIIYTVLLSVPENFKGELSNTATVKSPDFDPQLNNNIATDIDTPCETCKIPKGISPNGDTLNDVFDLSYFSGVNKLEIFNRNGQKVYSKENYTNQWGGQTDNGKELPTGTYYYIIYFEARPVETGWVYINR